MKNKKIPKFKSLKAEARFWDTHDVTDYLDDLELVEAEVYLQKNKQEILTVRVQPELKTRLGRIAQTYGVNLSTLARIWLIDKLKESKKTKLAPS